MGAAPDALELTGFAFDAERGVWSRGSVTARGVGGWLELVDEEPELPAASRDRQPASRAPAQEAQSACWAAPFSDPAFGTADPWRRDARGARVFELPAGFLSYEEDPRVLAAPLRWALCARPGDGGVSSGAVECEGPVACDAPMPGEAPAYQRGPVVRHGEITTTPSSVHLRMPILTVSIDAVDPARRPLLSELLADAAERWRWIRLGVDDARRPSVEISLPPMEMTVSEALVALARDGLDAFLDWIVAGAEVVASCEARCFSA